MAIKVGINGVGVLGRRLIRMMLEGLWEEGATEDKFDVVAINDPNISPENFKYLYNHDTVYGKPKYSVGDEIVNNGNGEYKINIGGKNIRYTGKMSATTSAPWQNCKWGEVGAFIVFDCMGSTPTLDKQSSHITAGATYVITCVGHSRSGDINMYVYSINESYIKSDNNHVYACPNGDMIATSLLLTALNSGFGVDSALCEHMTSYTNGNNLQDSALSTTEPQIGRAGAWNIIPCTSAAAKSIGRLIPELNGKCNGFEHRCGTIAGSHTDIFANLQKDFTVSEYSSAVKAASTALLNYSEDTLETSSDVIGIPAVIANANNYTLLSSTFVRAGVTYDAISVQANNAIQLAITVYNG